MVWAENEEYTTGNEEKASGAEPIGLKGRAMINRAVGRCFVFEREMHLRDTDKEPLTSR